VPLGVGKIFFLLFNIINVFTITFDQFNVSMLIKREKKQTLADPQTFEQ